MRTEKTIARRYALALISLAKQQGLIDAVKQDLAAVSDLYRSRNELSQILANPLISLENKNKTVRNIFRNKVNPITLKFLKTLLSKRRIESIPDIAELFNVLSDESQGIIRARVTSAFPLNQQEESALQKKLASVTGKQVVIQKDISRAILGGLSVQVGDLVMDGSALGSLRKMKEQLIGAK
ncbi:MAG: F0F1 ATP synthase subunit delta [Planctomycetes bacterium]|nr:F0F1 ATP synthase subunit delta [Planctomycetota bacterium]